MKKIISFFAVFFITLVSFAQDQTQDVDMADVMRSNGKIYVVLAVVLVIFTGLIIYLMSIDRKVSKIEKHMNKK